MACKHTWVQALHGVHVIPGDASVGTLQECSNLLIMASFIYKHSTQDEVKIQSLLSPSNSIAVRILMHWLTFDG